MTRTMKTSFLLFLLSCSSYLSAQKFEWAKSDGGSGNESASDLATNPANGTHYIIGTFENTLTLGTFTLNSLGASDVFFAKLDAGGNYLWAKSVGSAAADEGNSIAYDAGGNVYIAGGCRDVMTFSTSPTLEAITPMGAQNGFLAKYDTDGNFLWLRDINNNLNAGDESAKAIDICEQTAYLFLGIDEPGQNQSRIRR